MNASGTPRGTREREEDGDGRKRLKKTCRENKGLLNPKHPDGMEYPPEDGDAGEEEEEEEEVILSIDLVHTSRLIYYGNDIADESGLPTERRQRNLIPSRKTTPQEDEKGSSLWFYGRGTGEERERGMEGRSSVAGEAEPRGGLP
ncbi:hypothetical protein RUM44_007256 [Polyplax serrata]|uniref:Uncharacterized protein n=1 Tax=Polyplax serrata TaxID=468196 RepID=A0ABR1B072_POLSC